MRRFNGRLIDRAITGLSTPQDISLATPVLPAAPHSKKVDKNMELGP
jgi:hypothetical protein